SVKRYKFVNPNREVIMTRSPQATKAKVIGDSSKLIQMFTALLSNADKFSPSDKPIRVEIDKDKKLLSLRITDQGEGIERSEQHKIFEGFYKGSQTEAEGLGVGLLLTKHIVQYHHGEISIKSEKNRGTMVRVDLPTLL
nr:ATP-binding protein [Candidatus Levybacteria bacterium]